MKKIQLLCFLLMIAGAGFAQPLALSYDAATNTIDGTTFPKNGLSYNILNPDKINILVFNLGRLWGNRPYTDFTYNSSTFPSRDSLISFLNSNFFGDTSSGGGGDSVTLQVATDNGNTSSNAIIVTGSDNFSTSINGIQIINGFGIFGINPSNPITPLQNSLSFTNASSTLQFQGKNSIAIREPDPGDNTAPVSIEGQSGDLIRIRAAPATQSQDLITLEQLQTIGFQNIGDLNNGDTLITSIYYVFLGSDPASFTLPDPNGNSGRRIYFINDSADPVTLLSYGGGNTISDLGVKSNTGTIVAGQNRILICNGIYWYFIQ